MNIFVFGSNLAGIHGAGSAKEAYKKHGAIWGQGYGLAGNSFAIPTKDRTLKRLTLDEIKFYVDNFKEYAHQHPKFIFNVVKIGCGLAGYTVKQIAPMFDDAPLNCKLHKDFNDYLSQIHY